MLFDCSPELILWFTSHPTPLTDSIDSSSISWSHNNLGRRFLEV